jgi:hypothetical protein
VLPSTSDAPFTSASTTKGSCTTPSGTRAPLHARLEL